MDKLAQPGFGYRAVKWTGDGIQALNVSWHVTTEFRSDEFGVNSHTKSISKIIMREYKFLGAGLLKSY